MAREHTHVHQSLDFSAEARLRLIERCDALRRPERFAQLLLACECDARGRAGLQDRAYPQRTALLHDLKAVQSVDQSAISAAALAAGKQGPAIGQAIHAARLAALRPLR